jgi:hypothetical protein
MSKQVLIQELSRLLQDPSVDSALGTVGETGIPTVVSGAELFVTDRGTLLYREPLEFSVTTLNLTRSLWFNRPVAFSVRAGDVRLHGRGVPVQAHITGDVFVAHYRDLRARDPLADLAAVWEIRIDSIEDVSPALQRRQEDERRPFFRHLDRLL